MLGVASAELVISPDKIDVVITQTETINVQIKNTYNGTITVKITPSDDAIDISANQVTISPNHTATIQVTVSPTNLVGAIVYSCEYAVVIQKVKIADGRDYSIIVHPSSIRAETLENETEVYSIVFNPTDRPVNITIESDLDVDPSSFKLDPHESKIVKATAEIGTHSIKYKYDFGFKEGEITQSVRVKKVASNILNELNNLRNKVKELQTEINLPDKVRIQTEGGKVGKPLKITVQGYVDSSWKPLERVLVKFDNDVKFTDSQGVAYFIPSTAGLKQVSVYDRLGNVKAEKYVNISKAHVKLEIRDTTVGKPVRIELPEKGKITIYREGVKVYEADGNKSYTFTPQQPGEYVVKFTSQGYEGSGWFNIKGKVFISLEVNGKTISTGQSIEPGSTVKIKFKYDNGRPVKEGITYIGLPITAFIDTSTEQGRMYAQMFAMFAMFSGRSNFEPPNNIVMKKHIKNGYVTITIPKTADGFLTVRFEGDEYTEGDSIMVRIGKAESAQPIPYNIVVPTIIGITVILLAVSYFNNYFGFADKLSDFKLWLKKKINPPDELGV